MDDSENENARAWHAGQTALIGLLGTSVAGIFALLPVESLSRAQTIAIACFASSVPFLSAQIMDLYRPDRQRYSMRGWPQRIVTAFVMIGPLSGFCAALAHVFGWFTIVFLGFCGVAMWAYGTPFVHAKTDAQAKKWSQQQPPKTLYVPDPHNDGPTPPDSPARV